MCVYLLLFLHVSVIGKLASAYIKCLNLFFGFSKYNSGTAMLLQLGVPSFKGDMQRFFNNLIKSSF